VRTVTPLYPIRCFIVSYGTLTDRSLKGRVPMRARLAMICLTMTLLVGISSPTVRAQTTYENDTLKDINALFVIVEDVSSGATELGLTKEILQTDVELKLRLAGISVVTKEAGIKLPGAPYLWVQVTVTEAAHAANIAVAVRQDVRLERNDGLAFGASTWDVNLTVASPTAQGIRDYNKDIIDKFLNAWLSVNPKK
jgi:hypothetical protein